MDNFGIGSLSSQLSSYERLKNQGHDNITSLKKYINKPEYNRPDKTFNLTEVERLTEVPRSSIREKEKSGDIPYEDDPAEYYEDSLKKSYKLKHINKIREVFNKGFFKGRINRPENKQPLIISFSMFKGGVGKTIQATHLAAHCALVGLRTLLVDLDPQASATFVFGHIPSIDLETGSTILSSLVDDSADIHNVIKPTHYSGLDIITSGLELQAADLILPNSHLNNHKEMGSPLLRLKKALESVKSKYDIIILDCAPNHAATTMNALAAADGVILPISPNMLSYGSSIQFIQTLEELTSTLLNFFDDPNVDKNEIVPFNDPDKFKNKLFRILITNDPGDTEAQDVSAAIRGLYGNYVLPHSMIRSIALSRSSNDLGLLYDVKRSEVRGSKEAFDRGILTMKIVNESIISIFSSLWEL